jgi:hypothetical protein
MLGASGESDRERNLPTLTVVSDADKKTGAAPVTEEWVRSRSPVRFAALFLNSLRPTAASAFYSPPFL